MNTIFNNIFLQVIYVHFGCSWGYLEVVTNADFSSELQVYGAGVIEAKLTKVQVYRIVILQSLEMN